ncbi:electron transfer flavoprotein subunit beta/FixA family protein [Wukongibacter baidiensis]|uniref:electron transfer flavoprotein subunit beta/FixA family protein n=1 Tax=Wukongibacter baidiensis TaxID=1723361 RepID=UPI003D7F83DB
MKILVLVKEIIDTESKIVLDPSNHINESEVSYTVNIYDEYALEEAIRIKERFGGEVIIYSVCRDGALDTFRYIMSMGADKATLIKSGIRDSITVCELLANAIREENNDFDLILAGWVGIDQNNGQVPGRISQILGIPFINIVTKLDIDGKKIVCEREGEVAQEIIETELPALVTIQRGINVPRQPTAHNIMESKKEKIRIIDSGIKTRKDNLKVTYEYPKTKKVGYKVDEMEPSKAIELLIKKLLEDKVL